MGTAREEFTSGLGRAQEERRVFWRALRSVFSNALPEVKALKKENSYFSTSILNRFHELAIEAMSLSDHRLLGELLSMYTIAETDLYALVQAKSHSCEGQDYTDLAATAERLSAFFKYATSELEFMLQASKTHG